MTLQRSNYKACYTAGNLRNSAITICHSKSSPIPEGPKVVSDLPTNHFNTISRIKLHSSTRVGSLWVHGTTPGYVYWSITMTTKVTYMMTAKESPALFIYISGATHFVLNEWFIHFTKVDRTLGLDSKLARGSKSKTIRRNKHCWGYCPSESHSMVHLIWIPLICIFYIIVFASFREGREGRPGRGIRHTRYIQCKSGLREWVLLLLG